jgi:hypothetical protein
MTVDQPRFHRMVKNKCALCSSQRKKAVSATPVQASSDLIHALTPFAFVFKLARLRFALSKSNW